MVADPSTPAGYAIKAFGSVAKLAAAIGAKRTTVGYWRDSGVIPVGWLASVLEAAKARKIPLNAEQLIRLSDRRME